MMYTTFLLTADVAPAQPNSQQWSMFRLIGSSGHFPQTGFDSSLFFLNPNGRDQSRVCDWCGVYCTDEIITSIEWLAIDCNFVRLPYLDLRWIPPSTQSVQIRNQSSALKLSEFSTRHLPRSGVSIDLWANKLRGSLDLRKLPDGLSYLNLGYNELSGTVVLTSLPPNIEQILVEENRIQCVLVWNADIPRSLKTEKFTSKKKVRFIEVTGKRVHPSVRR
mmetsp:Transcript_8877/g.13452  ORF Transcript_8877/g.13452 Transcript_8877/m.13452 type:complete len:220 (-) Transcript_8877:47-706(-)